MRKISILIQTLQLYLCTIEPWAKPDNPPSETNPVKPVLFTESHGYYETET